MNYSSTGGVSGDDEEGFSYGVVEEAAESDEAEVEVKVSESEVSSAEQTRGRKLYNELFASPHWGPQPVIPRQDTCDGLWKVVRRFHVVLDLSDSHAADRFNEYLDSDFKRERFVFYGIPEKVYNEEKGNWMVFAVVDERSFKQSLSV